MIAPYRMRYDSVVASKSLFQAAGDNFIAQINDTKEELCMQTVVVFLMKVEKYLQKTRQKQNDDTCQLRIQKV